MVVTEVVMRGRYGVWLVWLFVLTILGVVRGAEVPTRLPPAALARLLPQELEGHWAEARDPSLDEVEESTKDGHIISRIQQRYSYQDSGWSRNITVVIEDRLNDGRPPPQRPEESHERDGRQVRAYMDDGFAVLETVESPERGSLSVENQRFRVQLTLVQRQALQDNQRIVLEVRPPITAEGLWQLYEGLNLESIWQLPVQGTSEQVAAETVPETPVGTLDCDILLQPEEVEPICGVTPLLMTVASLENPGQRCNRFITGESADHPLVEHHIHLVVQRYRSIAEAKRHYVSQAIPVQAKSRQAITELGDDAAVLHGTNPLNHVDQLDVMFRRGVDVVEVSSAKNPDNRRLSLCFDQAALVKIAHIVKQRLP